MGWSPPKDAVDITGNTALINKLKKEHGMEVTPDDDVVDAPTSANPANEISAMGGACDQGKCPDYFKPFDMMYTWTQIEQPGGGGAPPTTIVWNDFVVRVNDCDKCYSHKVGSTHGGCYDFTACGRKQAICVDSGKDRAHRIWKDSNVKKCYKMTEIGLGGCGFVQARVIWRPDNQVACNW
ncbi:hypothetical protein K4F52_009860 [Lecanicillium sp. MT-2017a]|nr:hypothetical protein K4F52_009860 [Lecanicillium sp. MT-2017a]